MKTTSPHRLSHYLAVAIIGLSLQACSPSEDPKPSTEPATKPVTPTKPPETTPKPVATSPKKDEVGIALRSAEQLLNMQYTKIPVKTEDAARNSLKEAYSHIQNARAIAPNDPRINESLNALENKYLEFIEGSAEDRAYNRATNLIEDAKTLDIPQTEIAAQQENIGKAILKKARMMERL